MNKRKEIKKFEYGKMGKETTSSIALLPYSKIINHLKIIINHSFIYDSNGNLIKDRDNYYEYNGFNWLVRVKSGDVSGSVLAEYWYNHDGDRIKKIDYNFDGLNTTTYYIGDSFVQFVNSSGVFNQTYYYDNEKLVGENTSSSELVFYHSDHLGSTSLITNSSGDVEEETFYLPFGEVAEGGEESRYSYEGKEKDNTGLDYFGVRYYSDEMRIFTQPDTIFPDVYDPQQLNRYMFERGNPYTNVEKEGRASIPIHYVDTFEAYWTAGYSIGESHQVAMGAIVPDISKTASASNLARKHGLNIQLEHGDDPSNIEGKYYYHEYSVEGRDLEGDYKKAVKERDLTKMGTIEHAFYDVGNGGVPGYHQHAGTLNQINKFVLHDIGTDILSIGVDRGGLQKEQKTRAQQSARQHGTEASKIEKSIKSAITKFIKAYIPGI